MYVSLNNNGQTFYFLGSSIISPAIQTKNLYIKSQKQRKLHPSLRSGGDNGGLEYGVEIMKAYVVK